MSDGEIRGYFRVLDTYGGEEQFLCDVTIYEQ